MKSDTYSRVNISLPNKTLRRIDRLTDRGDRSRLIDTAVNFYMEKRSREQLQKTLKEGALTRAQRDLEIAEELFVLNDSWENE